MQLSEVANSIKQIWEAKPGMILLLLLVFAVFVFLVIDAWLHKRRRRPSRRQRHQRRH